ncbi:MAG: histidine--tRNA ligase [Actinobacteria bacterium]|nr:histidine--tRNA ligase [Actinomycetota bacterium]
MELAPPRGTDDLLPPGSEAILGLYDEAHRAARRFGFRYVETPTFEHTEVFARTSGDTSDVVSKEMYTFQDKGGRSMTLRPESTAGVVRAYLRHAHDLPSPFKAYYVNTNFRHNRPQAGRLREFRVFGVEVIGAAGAAADVEVISLAHEYLRARGLRDVTLQLNSIGDEVCRPEYRARLIDHFGPYLDRLDQDCRDRLQTNPLRVFDCKVDGGKDFVLAAPKISDHLCEECATHFAGVRAGLELRGIGAALNPDLVRGLDYYTRTAFEFASGAVGGPSAVICGGGRYDGLAEALGGPAAPGVGFGMGLDRVLLAMRAGGAPMPEGRGPTCFVVTIGPEGWSAGDALLRELRAAGVAAASAYEERPLKAQLKMADRAGAAFVAILGEKERAEGVVTLRRLADGMQKVVGAGEAVMWLTRLDGWTDA